MLRSGILFCALLLIAAAAPAAMTPLQADGQGEYRFGACHAQLKGSLLTVGNGLVERQWRITFSDPSLQAISLRDLASGREWLARGANLDKIVAEARARKAGNNGRLPWELSAEAGQAGATEEPSLMLTLRMRGGRGPEIFYRIQVFAGARGFLMDLALRPSNEPGVQPLPYPHLTVLERLNLDTSKLRLAQVNFLDQTDRQAGPLVTETELGKLDPATSNTKESRVGVGNVFFAEDKVNGDGLLFVKHAPLPAMRPLAQGYKGKLPPDLVVNNPGWTILETHEFSQGLGKIVNGKLERFGANEPETFLGAFQSYRWVTLAYQGGRPGRIAALQEHYRNLRQYEPGRDGVLLTNTWGDRSKDGRVSEAFMKKEIDAAERLGVDAIMIDDGWQKGTTMNSVKKGGVWNGFYAAAQDFWSAHPERFPNGIKPLAELAKSKGIQFGLWFAPDSSGDFQNWEKDRDLVLGMHRERGVNYFKFDGIKMHSRAGEANVHKLVGSVVEGSQGRISIDLDVTAEVRPGYFGIPNHGPIFVENRYSDTAAPDPEKRANSYWPHKTLRNFWLLAQYVDPVRLRMEFLNNSRNVAKYGSNPLAPSNYEPDYLFAAVMFGSPLGWFETQNLPPAYFEKVAPLVRVWKANREAIFRGSIIPVGEAPSGKSWTGFFSAARDGKSGYALVFRELNDQGVWRMALPLMQKGEYEVEKLAGDAGASAKVEGGELKVKIPEAKRYLFVKVARK